MKPSERNADRRFVTVMESGDDRAFTGLQGMMVLTRDLCVRCGLDVSKWPESVSEVMNGPPPEGARVIQRTDDYGETHRFLLLPYDDHDLLLGVSSRREVNVPGRMTGNVASNLLIELLSPPPGPRHVTRVAPYGTVIARVASRLWRRETAASHIQDVCREWHIWIVTHGWTFDPADRNSSLHLQIQGGLDTAQAEAFVENSTAHRRAAHEGGIAKFARSKTHPAIAINRQTGRMTYDLNVVRVIREMADRIIDGWTFDELAAKFAEQLPTYTLQEEEDHPGPDKKTGRTRSERNDRRKESGRPLVPLRYLDDGTPNPAYRPETMADMADPASALRKMFSGPTLHKHLRGADLDQLTREDLDGIHPRRAYLAFLATGVYRRLHRDQERSGRTFSRFRWITYDMGQADEAGFILTPSQAKALQQRLELPPADVKQTRLPLAGLFDVWQLGAPLYTGRGILTAVSGRLVFRTGHNTQADPGYRIYHELPGAAPHGRGSAIMAWLPAHELHASVVEGIITALDGHGEPVELTLPAQETDRQRERRRLEREHEDATAEFEATVRALKDLDLSERQRQVLKGDVNTVEQRLDDIEAQLHLNGTDADADTADVDVPLKALPDVLGAIASAPMLPTAIAESCRRILKAVFRDAILQLDPTNADVVWRARLELETTDGGNLHLPVNGRVLNRTNDTWIGGAGGQFWAGRPFHIAWERLENKTPAGQATRWREPLVNRLLTDEAIVTPLRDRDAASLLVRCPDPTLLGIALDLLRGDAPDANPELVAHTRKLFFDANLETPFSWKTRVCQNVLQAVDHAATGELTPPR